VLHIRLRKGSATSEKGMLRFGDELIARVGRAGAEGVKLFRAHSGSWNINGWSGPAGGTRSGTPRQKGIQGAVEAIDEDAWQTIDYPDQAKRRSPKRLRRQTADHPHRPGRRARRALARLAT
jgi:hypothetical protein